MMASKLDLMRDLRSSSLDLRAADKSTKVTTAVGARGAGVKGMFN
jgi:hypothetical protein